MVARAGLTTLRKTDTTSRRKQQKHLSRTENKPKTASTADTHDIYKHRVKRRRIERHRLPTSRLEALPAEILEQIFLKSLNPNFALASPHILVKVSHPFSLQQFAVKCFGYVRSPRHGFLVTYPDLPLKPDKAVIYARNVILRSEWLNYELFVRCCQLVVDRARQQLLQLAPAQASQEDFFPNLALWLGSETNVPERLLYTTPVPFRRDFLVALTDAGASIGSTNSYAGEMATDLILHGIRTKDKSLSEMDIFKLSLMPSQEQATEALESINYDLDIVETVECLYYRSGRRDQPRRSKPFERICARLGPKASARIKQNIRQAGGWQAALQSLGIRMDYKNNPIVGFEHAINKYL